MSNDSALRRDEFFRRVIPARFVSTRDGRPMHCMTCDAVLVHGEAYAAVTDQGTWVSFCEACADDEAAQIKGLYATTVAALNGGPVPIEAQDTVRAFLTDESQATFQACKAALLALRNGAQAATLNASAFDVRLIPAGTYTAPDGASIKIDTPATGKWADWVFVKRDGEKMGNARPGQAYRGAGVDDLREILENLQPLTQSSVPQGYFATVSRTGNNDLDFWFVKVDDETQVTTVKRVIGGHPDTPVRKPEALAALAAIASAGVDTSGMVYATALGHCMRCNRHLTDQESRIRGRGPECANKGWGY
jgi:hypothetical protein